MEENTKRGEVLRDAQPIQPSGTATSGSTQVVYAVPVYTSNDQYQEYTGVGATAYQQEQRVNILSSSASGAPAAQQSTVLNVPQATLVAVVQTNQFGANPQRVICQFCGADVITAVRVTPSITAHLWALGLCVFGCWPCCVVPYFVNDCQSHEHICPNCQHQIGFHGL